MMVLAAWQIVPRDPISRKPITKRTGGVGQDVGPEFKPKEGRKEGGRKGGREGRRKEGRKEGRKETHKLCFDSKQ
jgi:hypothetical protein